MSEQGEGHVGSTEAGQGRGRQQTERFGTAAYWLLAVFLIGLCAGTGAAFKYHAKQLDKSIEQGGFMHGGAVYEVKEKVQK